MVKIRLTRMGRKKHAFYRIVAVEAKSKRDGRPLESLGYYNPNTVEVDCKIDMEKLERWVKSGAVLTPTVASLVRRLGTK